MATLKPKFEKIDEIVLTPTQQAKLKDGIAKYGYNWEHSNFSWFKTLLNTELRRKQHDRCCYCRRPLLFKKGLVDIEHIVDKGSDNGKYAAHMFTVRNLALSCRDCNNNKGTKPVLRDSRTPIVMYPRSSTRFTWVHPYLHNYSDHLTIHRGWVYEAKAQSPEGAAVIEKCMLFKLEGKERASRQILVSAADSCEDAIVTAVGLVPEVGVDRLCVELAPHLHSMYKNKDPKKITDAIRAANVAARKAIRDALA
ncbi:HNH endonuclease [Paraburkholderia xenovorans]|jgi:5-methylcytosine-specific restriction endonuclease McrA